MLKAGVNGLAGGGAGLRRAVSIVQTGTPSTINTVKSVYDYNDQDIGPDVPGRLAAIMIKGIIGTAGTRFIDSLTIDGVAADHIVQDNFTGTSSANVAAIAWRVGVVGTTADFQIAFNADVALVGVCPYSIVGARHTDAFFSDSDTGASAHSLSVPFPVGCGVLATAGARDASGAPSFVWTGVIEDFEHLDNVNNSLTGAHLDGAAHATPLGITLTPSITPTEMTSVAVGFYP